MVGDEQLVRSRINPGRSAQSGTEDSGGCSLGVGSLHREWNGSGHMEDRVKQSSGLKGRGADGHQGRSHRDLATGARLARQERG